MYQLRFPLVAILLLWLHPALAQVSYRLTPIGQLPGSFQMYGSAMNDAGQVTGYAAMTSDEAHAFLWNGTTLTDIGLGEGIAINGAGWVTGRSCDIHANCHAFLWDGAAMRDIGGGSTDYGAGNDINDAGQVTGVSCFATGCHAFLWSNGTFKDLGTLGGSFSEGVAINANGQVVGRAERADGTTHAFLWDGSQMLDLGTLGGADSAALDINNAGKITGYSDSSNGSQAFLWNGTRMISLAPAGALESRGIRINNHGHVILSASTKQMLPIGWPYYLEGAYLWDGASIRNLGTLPPKNEFRPLAMNESDEVVGDAWEVDNLEGKKSLQIGFLWSQNTLHDIDSLIAHGSGPGELPSNLAIKESVRVNRSGQVLTVGCEDLGGYLEFTHCQVFVATPIGNLRLAGLQLTSDTVAGCRKVTGTVALSQAAPTGGTRITLTDDLASASLPASIRIAAGTTSKSFSITTVPVSSVESGTITASLDGTAASAALTVRSMGLQSIGADTALATGGNSIKGKATLECAAGPGGVMVDLGSSNPALAHPVAGSISVPQGMTAQEFDIVTTPVTTAKSVRITGSANGIVKSKTVQVAPAGTKSP